MVQKNQLMKGVILPLKLCALAAFMCLSVYASGQAGDCCDQGDKVITFTFQYTGEGCNATNNSQSGGKSDCDQFNGGPAGDASVYVVSSKEDDGTGDIFFQGNVSLNETFTVAASNAGEDKFPSNTYHLIYSSQGGQLLQRLQIHASCSAPVVIGDQFGGLVLQNATFQNGVSCGPEVCDPLNDGGTISGDEFNCAAYNPDPIDNVEEPDAPPVSGGGDCCETGGDKVQSFTFRYVGDGCGSSNTSQSSGKFECDDNGGGPSGDNSVYIISAKEDDGSGDIYFSGTVGLNETFTASALNAGEDDFPSKTYHLIYSSQGGQLLQTLNIHASCSAPVVPGDQFGGLILEGATFKNGFSCGAQPANVEYAWTSSTNGCPTNFNNPIAGATGPSYNPGFISQTTYYVRWARQDNCVGPNGGEAPWTPSNCVVKTVGGGDNDGDGVCANEDCDDNNPNVPGTPGTPCNDGNPNTINDVLMGDGCTCMGTPIDDCANAGGDSDDDGVCNNDDCAPFDPNFPKPAGTACNDFNPNTVNDVIQSDGCTCVGTPVDDCANAGGDSDDDGVCNNDDCAPFDPNFPKPAGTPCNDFNPNTTNDVIQSDGCTCAGTPVGGGCNVGVSSDGCTVTINGLTASVTNVKIFNSSFTSILFSCNPWEGNPCDVNEAISNLNNGTYIVSVITSNNGVEVCNFTQSVTINCGVDPCAGQGGDSDNDGVCNNQDCQPFNPAFPATPGTPCDDGNPNTTNDVVQANGCSCAGTPVDACATRGGDSDNDGVCNNDDCQPFNPAFPATPGTSCDDGNPNTINDVVQANGCSCAGTPVDACATRGGDSDNDGVCNNDDCQPFNPAFPATPGTPCNDGNPNTINDVVQANGCSCAGTPIGGGCNVVVSTDGCKITITGLTDAVKSVKVFDNSNWNMVFSCNPWGAGTCDPTETINGLPNATYLVSIYTTDGSGGEVCNFGETIRISCGGNPCDGQGGDSDNDGVCNNLDCQPFNPAFPAFPGTPCDDGNPNTVNDVVQNDGCSCAGTSGPSGCNTTSNLALGQPTQQSTTISAGGITGFSSKAVDGNTNGVFFTYPLSASSVSATTYEFEAWWEVDLGAEYLIEEIRAYNRTDGADKTGPCYLMISSTPFADDLATARSQSNYEHYDGNSLGTPSVDSPNAVGRYVRIQLVNSGYLTLAEVEVYGCPVSQGYTIPNLMSFQAEKEGIESHLSWVMKNEKNVDHYELEVSADEQTFQLLERVQGIGQQAARQYHLTDAQPNQGDNYYRLKVVLNDGSHYYSPTRKVSFETDLKQAMIFPNPTNHTLNVIVREHSGKAGSIEIYNNLGQSQHFEAFDAIPDGPIPVSVQEFVPGMYTLIIKVGKQRRIAKQFVVVDR